MKHVRRRARFQQHRDASCHQLFFLQGKAPKEIHAILTEILGEPSYAIDTDLVAQFKRDDFSTCDAPRPGRHKTLTIPEIIDLIHKLFFADRRILAKKYLRNWASHVSALGPSLMKIWTCGSSSRSGSRNA
jgi:hypothetical protein